MPLYIFLLTRSRMPANWHQPNCQFLVVGLVLVGWHMALCKQEDFAKWHFFYYFLLYFNVLYSVGLLHWVQPSSAALCMIKKLHIFESKIDYCAAWGAQSIVRFFSNQLFRQWDGTVGQSYANVCIIMVIYDSSRVRKMNAKLFFWMCPE